MYKKIDIYVDGKYVALTLWAKTLQEAKRKFIKEYVGDSMIKSVDI